MDTEVTRISYQELCGIFHHELMERSILHAFWHLICITKLNYNVRCHMKLQKWKIRIKRNGEEDRFKGIYGKYNLVFI